MGISFDLDAESMESEIKPAGSNKNLMIADELTDVDTEASAIVPESIVVNEPTKSFSYAVPSPQFQETETIVIDDDAEPEEGEIINSDSDNIEVEYEAISSDEEFTLRQKIEALEARNLELEKIASISARAHDVYDEGYARPSIFGSCKPTTPTDDFFFTSSFTRSNIPIKTKPSLSSTKQPYYRSQQFAPTAHFVQVENISSDETHQSNNSENEFSTNFLASNTKSHSRSSHKSAKKERHQNRRKNKSVDSERETRCRVHSKRRCTDIVCNGVVALRKKEKRCRSKHDERKLERAMRTTPPAKVKQHQYCSSDDECIKNREELKVALNIKEIPSKFHTKSTLSHKLTAIRKQSAELGKKSNRKRVRSKSSDNLVRSNAIKKKRKHSGSHEATTQKTDFVTIRYKTKLNLPQSEGNENNDDEDDDDDNNLGDGDEAISLEEQELRLIALKSAVLKKHEARKKRQMAQSIRPYSPTDSILFADDIGDRTNDCIGSDNNNMDISPVSSPHSFNQCQPMDMELATSNENSKSPVFSFEKSSFQPIDQYPIWNDPTLPLSINKDIVNSLNSSYPIPNPFQPLIQNAIVDDVKPQVFSCETPNSNVNGASKGGIDNEIEAAELRAQLIANLKTPRSLCTATERSETFIKVENVGKAAPNEKNNEDANQDESLEADCLRSMLLRSIKLKKSFPAKESATNGTQSPTSSIKFEKLTNGNVIDTNVDMPKLTLNLKEALKRLKNIQRIKKLSEDESETPNLRLEKCNLDTTHHQSSNSLENSSNDAIIPRTKNHLDKNRNELSKSTKTMPVPSPKPPKLPEKPSETKIQAEKCDISSNSVKPLSGSKKSNLSVANMKRNELETVKINSQKQVTQNTITLNKIAAFTQSQLIAKVIPKQVVNVASVATISSIPFPSDPIKTAPPATTKTISAQLTKTVHAKASTSFAKLEVMKKSSSSPVPVWVAKPVKKLIISLNSESSTDDFDDYDNSNDENTKDDENRKSINTRLFDNLSPASMAMDSPSFAPSSPIGADTTSSLNADNSSNDTASLTNSNNENPTKKNVNANDTTSTFQMKLDEYLKTVRAKTEAIKETKKVVSPIVATKAAKKQLISFSQNTPVSSPTTDTSKAVCHLPISSQLEYRRLINRMKLLEKQKEQKSRLMKQQQSQQPQQQQEVTLPDSAFPTLKVIVQNENRFIRAINESTNEVETLGKPLSLTQHNIQRAPTESLKRKVLVKNTINSLVNVQQNSLDLTILSQSHTTEGKATTVSEASPSPNTFITEQTLTGDSQQSSLPVNIEKSKNSADKPLRNGRKKETQMSIATLVKKTPKMKTAVLRHYLKQFRSHRLKSLADLEKMHQLMCRTQIETKKQLDLELELEELRKKCKIVEEDLKQQKALTRNLYPTIAATQHTITSNRSTARKLANCCNRLGRLVKGPNYKLKCDKEIEIEEKSKLISFETNKLKILQQSKPVALLHPTNSEIIKINVAGSQNLEFSESISDLALSKQDSSSNCAATDDGDTKQKISNPAITVSNESSTLSTLPIDENNSALIVVAEKSSDRPASTTLDGNTFTDADMSMEQDDDDAKCGKYCSPLDHMQNNVECDAGPRHFLNDIRHIYQQARHCRRADRHSHWHRNTVPLAIATLNALY